MSAEDLETQPADTSVKLQYFPLKGSAGDGLDSLLLKGKGILKSGSLPSLIDASSPLNEDEEEVVASPEGNVNASSRKGQTQPIIIVSGECSQWIVLQSVITQVSSFVNKTWIYVVNLTSFVGIYNWCPKSTRYETSSYILIERWRWLKIGMEKKCVKSVSIKMGSVLCF